MKNKYLFLILIVSIAIQTKVSCQNLVPNPLFSTYDTCPYTLGQVQFANGWSAFLNSPDYYNTCADSASYVSVPHSGAGYQEPYLGNAYMGFQTFFTSNYREIVGCQLSNPLTVGVKYYVSIEVNRAYALTPFGYRGATNKIGARFSMIPYGAINNFAHVYTDSIITDTLNWTLISGSIIADSAYQYIGLGNFFDDQHTDTIQGRSYYFLGAVCVTTDSLGCDFSTNRFQYHSNQKIKIYPNPVNENLNIQFDGVDVDILHIYNYMGGLIYEQNNLEGVVALQVDMKKFKQGIYYIQILNKKETWTEKISFVH